MDVISKKELLSATGISYGQLYRWKREQLIPEEWFIKQSSYTGQETFFPREQILERVRAIMAMKDSHSLEELAEMLASEGAQTVTLDDMRAWGGISDTLLAELPTILGKREMSLGESAFVYGIFHQEKNEFSDGQIAELVRSSVSVLSAIKIDGTQCTLFGIGNALHACFSRGIDYPVFDSGVSNVAVFSLGETANTLKTRLANHVKE